MNPLHLVSSSDLVPTSSDEVTSTSSFVASLSDDEDEVARTLTTSTGRKRAHQPRNGADMTTDAWDDDPELDAVLARCETEHLTDGRDRTDHASTVHSRPRPAAQADRMKHGSMLHSETASPPPQAEAHAYDDGNRLPRCSVCNGRLQHLTQPRCPWLACRAWLIAAADTTNGYTPKQGIDHA
jgi:hypothetical protein